MKETTKSMKRNDKKATRRGRPRAVLIVAIALALLGAVVLGVAAHSKREAVPLAKTGSAPLSFQSQAQRANHLQSKLSLQPEADRMRRRLGQRFGAVGRENSVLQGILNIGTEQHAVTIVRTRDEDDEGVSIALDGGPPSLTWSGRQGAVSAGRRAAGIDLQLLERLALDSPDQFVMAQLRGASYYIVARTVQPASAKGPDAYEGPVWDVVRVTEPQNAGVKPESLSRHYFINSDTGLLEKVVSDEQGQTVVAEISGWTTQGGERVPTRIVWSRDKQVVMELNLSSFATAARQ